MSIRTPSTYGHTWKVQVPPAGCAPLAAGIAVRMFWLKPSMCKVVVWFTNCASVNVGAPTPYGAWTPGFAGGNGYGSEGASCA